MMKRNAAYEKKNVIGKSLVVIYSSAAKVRSNTRTHEEHLFSEETIVIRDR